MDGVYSNLQENGNNNVESLIQWLKYSKVIDESEAQEKIARSLFDGVPDKTNVSFEQFLEVTTKIAVKYNISLEEITHKLVEAFPKTTVEEASKTTVEGATKATVEAGPTTAALACPQAPGSSTVASMSATLASIISAANAPPKCGTCDVPRKHCKKFS